MAFTRKLWITALSAGAAGLGVAGGMAGPAQAQTAAAAAGGVTGETAFILNTLSFLVHGALVMFMAAGFAMLESGLVRTKNTATICLKNVALYGVAGIMFLLTGSNLMYAGVDGGFIGSFGPWSADDSAVLPGAAAGGYAERKGVG